MTVRVQQAIALALLCLTTTLIFSPSVKYDFVNWDDMLYIHQNSWLRDLSFHNIVSMFGHYYNFNYHPLTILSYMVEFQQFELNPAGYHTTNVVLHVGTVMLLFGLMRLFNAGVWTSFFLAQLFAVHPLRVESVVWISERKDVLCSFFYLAALCLWVLAGKVQRSRERELVSLSILMFLLAILSKAMAISFPFVAFLHDLLRQRSRIRSRVPAYLLLLIVALFFSYLNLVAQQEPGKTSLTELKTAVYAPLHYAEKTLVPRGLVALYPMQLRPTANVLPVILGGLFCALVLAFALVMARRHREVTFGLLAAGIILAPVSGIVTPGYSYAADRYTYLPTAIILVGIAPALSRYLSIASAVRRMILLSCCAFLAIAYCSVTLTTSSFWATSELLWKRVLVVFPRSVIAQRNLAEALSSEAQAAMIEGRRDTAEQLVDDALRAFPLNWRALHLKLDKLVADGEYHLAEETLDRALGKSGWSYLGKAYALSQKSVFVRNRGEATRADSLLSEAFTIEGRQPPGAELILLAQFALDAGDTMRAIEYYQTVVDDQPLNERAVRTLAFLYAERGDDHHAFLLFHRLTELCPDDTVAEHNALVAARKVTTKTNQ